MTSKLHKLIEDVSLGNISGIFSFFCLNKLGLKLNPQSKQYIIGETLKIG